jgi:diguanylate cyclase (GGDEF)-like protein/PAS domain S-box-containing protein
MNAGRKLMLIVIASVVFVTIPAAGIIYQLAKENLMGREADNLVAETRSIVAVHSQNLAQAEPGLKSLALTLSKNLARPVGADETLSFDQLVQHDSDGAWRSRRENFDGTLEAGMFLPPDAPLDTAQKIQHLRAKQVLDVFGGSVTEPFTNVWLLTHGKTEIIYDHGVPDFALLMAADTDYTKTDWLTLGSPASNPERGLRWTPPLFDPVPRSWMLSAVMPVDVQGRWIGTVGHDIYLNNVFPMLFQQSQRYSGEVHLLLDAKGNFIQAGPWQKELEAKPESFKPDLHNEADLARLLATSLEIQPKSQNVSLQGRKYLAVGMIVPPVGWHYFRLIPTDEILAPMRSLVLVLAITVLIIGLLIGWMIEFAVKHNIINRLQLLSNTMRHYGQGDLNARSDLSGNDEIARTASEFNAMAEQMKATLDAIPDLLFDVGLDGHFYASHSPNPALLAAPEEKLIGKTVADMLPSHAAEIIMAALAEANLHGVSYGKQFELPLTAGKLWFELSASKKAGFDKENPRFIVLSRDITERKRVESELRIAATAFEAQEGMLISDAAGEILRVNKSFTKITGYSAEEVLGNNPRILNSGLHDTDFYREMWDKISESGNWEGEIWNRRKNGEVYPELLAITAVKRADGIISNYVATFSDISERKEAARKIEQLAFYDPLTGLPNRRMLVDRLTQALAVSSRNGQEGALLFLDLDHFKTINDTLGHHVGDMLLQQVAQRLSSCVREGDTVARLGGDEFVVMLEGLSADEVSSAEQTEAVGEKMLATLSRPYQLAGNDYHNTSSIGAVLFSGHQQSVDVLLQQADIAMYQVKQSGRNNLRFFDPEMQHAISVRAELESELRKALEKHQFQLYYQIQVDALSRPLGAEALIRWLHPERGLVPPVQFIHLAEETGLILSIGAWVLDTACAQLKIWQQDEKTRDFILAVNVSARQFCHSDFVDQVRKMVAYHEITPDRLKLELTESLLMDTIEVNISTMTALSEIGVQLSLDDFGTGYSSLQYLKRLPLDQLKIDQSFVRQLVTDNSDKAIVGTIIAMAESLSLDVIAEGVETEEQRQLLKQMGCNCFQGYLFGKPVPIEQFEALLK